MLCRAMQRTPVTLLFRRLLPLAAAAVLLLGAGVDEWKFDVLHLKNGKAFQGLLLKETAKDIRFQCVRRSPGTPTTLITTTFDRAEVASIDRLDDRDREALANRLKNLDPTGKGEAARMESLELEKAAWLDKKGEAWLYRSTHFTLLSNAREDIVRRAAVRLEQIYAAYVRFLPPRKTGAKATSIVLVQSLAEFRALNKAKGRDILNPAFYDSTTNEVVCASDLQRLGDELEKVRKDINEKLADVNKKEAGWLKEYKGRLPADLRSLIQEYRRKINAAMNHNDGVFREATQRLFQTLYHEAFHAYLANFVYPREEADVPRWLNEGLAQIFETAVVEGGELRVGHADKERLAQIKAAAYKNELLPLVDLLHSGPKQFVMAHASDQAVSNRHYLNSWAWAFYLAFDRKVLGTPALDDYVKQLRRGGDSSEAFRDLLGKPLNQVEKDFRQYLLKLREDGTVASGGR